MRSVRVADQIGNFISLHKLCSNEERMFRWALIDVHSS